ncbi:MAG TPA: carboxypeptidase-like regulatory domain-containing protein [Bryobacteraceae bacterium]|nr:carboxypeptidase-like regulatory domain-containing protein [Bryobacteraceae bacterium]
MSRQMRLVLVALGIAWAAARAVPIAVAPLSGVVRVEGTAAAGAEVTATNQESGQQFTAHTDAEGRYVFPSLPPGTYDVRVAISGFMTIRRTGVSIEAGKAASVDIDLSAGMEQEKRKKAKKARPPMAEAPTAEAPAPPPMPAPPPPPVGAGPGGEARLTGRAFLLQAKPETPGYGLYSYILLGAGPSEATRARYLATFQACLEVISDVRDFEAANIPRARLNITYLPVKQSPPQSVPAAAWVLGHYDLARSEGLLLNVPGGPHNAGPYIVSTLGPLSSARPDKYLYQDLSAVPEALIPAWIQQFLAQAGQAQYWQPRALSQMVLTLRTKIEVAGLALPNVVKSSQDFRSLLATWISEK